MIELYHGEPNLFSLKVLIGLHEKGLSFQSHPLDLTHLEHASISEYGAFEVQFNPEGEGPIFVDHGTAMTESQFLLLYLDEAYPDKPLRAPDAANRWRVLMWARFLNEVTAPAVSTLGCHRYLADELKSRNPQEMERSISSLISKEQQDGWRAAITSSYPDETLGDSRRKLSLSVKKIEAALADNDWLAGPNFSIADIDAFALLRPVAKNFPEFLDDAPYTAKWLARIEARPSVQAALAASKTGKPEICFTPGPEHSRWG